ncbi:nuclear transport factor 2 family protein [Massilia sp. YIM B02443]|uniref:YybH family protein n=1 Tax=Massilia sp. YIM B02443 TaxID=3050127 RepID=UPI0025B66F84|nr:nuclear transport factor 2 family protein [Massilia sp. YIM B02443]MDN4039145.1 nuclear transport factor 2 family protein [Massilia sp. YIM B02443]
MRLRSLSLIAACLLATVTVGSVRSSPGDLRRQVFESERAFAATMAARDFDGFSHFLAHEAIFMSGSQVLRGSDAVRKVWRRYYDGPRAPFSWQPAQVEVLASGTLAYSSGAIFDPDGKRIGSFNSVWRLEAPGRWRVVFDRGCDCRP